MRGVAVAHPNIALAKYWGKREGDGNYPAVPSLSVTLDGMATRTSVTFGTERADRFLLNGVDVSREPLSRVVELLARVRAESPGLGAALVESTNDFPTASGLASSASGFAALALAATHAARLVWDPCRVSDLARRSSASAARSVFGGFVELEAGPERPDVRESLSARCVAPAEHLDLAILVCVTTNQGKGIASTRGMRETAARSPYYGHWLSDAPRLYLALREALLARDIERLGELTEASAFQMHACAMAAGIIYVGTATAQVLDAVRTLRRDGTGAWATMDAGPHVKVIVEGRDVKAARSVLQEVPGVLRIIETRPGGPAHLLPEVAHP